jgi:hypothetical protein
VRFYEAYAVLIFGVFYMSNLTLDFSDASFDESSSDVQPVPGVDNIDVVFPISDDGSFAVAQADNRGASATSTGAGTGSATAIALMPDQATSGIMEEFLFEFDNDLGDHDSDAGTPNPQGLKITTEGGNNVIKETNIIGTFDNLTDGGTLDVYVDTGTTEDHDSIPTTAEIKVFDKFSLGAPVANTGDDMAILVSGDMNGADMGTGSDMAMINVDATADMSGLFQGGNGLGIDTLTLVEGVVQDNGARVDFGLGNYGPNSAVVSNYEGIGSGLYFDIAGWEVLELTGNADYVTIASGTGKSLTNAYDAAYWNAGADNSMLKIKSGYTDGGKADVIEINANSNIYLSFDFVDTNQGIDAVFLDNGNVTVDDLGGSGSEIDVDVMYAGGTGLTIDYLEGTKNADYVTNSGSKGITVDLGGSTGAVADVFDGSVVSKNDVMDARSVEDLTFAAEGSYIKVTSGTAVNAKLKDVDYIMVRDGAVTDPSTLVVAPTPGATFPASGAVGAPGVTDANNDGVVDLSDVQAFIKKNTNKIKS